MRRLLAVDGSPSLRRCLVSILVALVGAMRPRNFYREQVASVSGVERARRKGLIGSAAIFRDLRVFSGRRAGQACGSRSREREPSRILEMLKQGGDAAVITVRKACPRLYRSGLPRCVATGPGVGGGGRDPPIATYERGESARRYKRMTDALDEAFAARGRRARAMPASAPAEAIKLAKIVREGAASRQNGGGRGVIATAEDRHEAEPTRVHLPVTKGKQLGRGSASGTQSMNG